MLLKNKRILITGLANKYSIAAGIASAMHREGAELAFTYQNERLLKNLEPLAKEFGSDIREEGLYYLILIIGVSNVIIALQSFIQPVIEINNGRVALRTKEKALSVVRDIYEVKEIKKEEDKLLFIFEDGTYEVFTKNIKTEDTDMVIDYITNSKEGT